MQLTLKNARRLDTTIRNRIQELLIESHTAHSIVVSTTDHLVDRLHAAQQKVIQSVKLYTRLSVLRHDLRRRIEAKNESGGLNELMNQEAHTREVIQMLENNINSYNRSFALSPERLKTFDNRLGNMRKAAIIASDHVADEVSIVGIMPVEYIDEVKIELRRLMNVLSDLKDRCASANSDPNNSINLSRPDVEFLTQERLM